MSDFDVTTRHEKANCWNCGLEVDAMSGPCLPTAGDFSLCIECGSLLVVTDGPGLREPTIDEIAESTTMPEIQRIRAAINAANAPFVGPLPRNPGPRR